MLTISFIKQLEIQQAIKENPTLSFPKGNAEVDNRTKSNADISVIMQCKCQDTIGEGLSTKRIHT